nr:MAG TPA: hypothetical protein [Caudoviricetes sp.]
MASQLRRLNVSESILKLIGFFIFPLYGYFLGLILFSFPMFIQIVSR